MSEYRSRRARDDGKRHRHRSRSHDSREWREHVDHADNDGSPSPRLFEHSHSPRLGQSERRRHHRHGHKRPRRSLSPGEVAPEESRHSRHHSHKQKDKHHHNNETGEKSKSPGKVEQPTEPIQSRGSDSSDSDDVFGPMPAPQSNQQVRSSTRPRGRGEFGHDPKDIARYEQMGFVMSGNRKKRKQPEMTDEEFRKAGFAVQKEVRDLKEKELVARFKEMIETRKRESDAPQGSRRG